jgi:hypothetical protein
MTRRPLETLRGRGTRKPVQLNHVQVRPVPVIPTDIGPDGTQVCGVIADLSRTLDLALFVPR